MRCQCERSPRANKTASLRAYFLTYGSAIKTLRKPPQISYLRIPNRRFSLHLASFVVAGAAGAMEIRNGLDDEAIIDNVITSVLAAAQALRG